jgi:hypothetical protein
MQGAGTVVFNCGLHVALLQCCNFKLLLLTTQDRSLKCSPMYWLLAPPIALPVLKGTCITLLRITLWLPLGSFIIKVKPLEVMLLQVF